MKSNPKLCFVASGGGHLRQLLQLKPLMNEYQYYFVTENTAFGSSISNIGKTYFVPHFAFGQRKSEGSWVFLKNGFLNAAYSAWIFLKEWPDIVITSGAGAAFFTLILAYIFRKKIVYIESIARVTEVSLFGKLVSRFTGLTIVQWPGMIKFFKNACYCSPLVMNELESEIDRKGVFVTVGTVMPFDRLVGGVEILAQDGLLEGPVIAQIGNSTQKFGSIMTFDSCSFEELNNYTKNADVVICHGGSGSILGALKVGAHVVAMARLKFHGEHYDDHQIDITSAFENMGLISVAKDENDLIRAINEAKNHKRMCVDIDPNAFVKVIQKFIDGDLNAQS